MLETLSSREQEALRLRLGIDGEKLRHPVRAVSLLVLSVLVLDVWRLGVRGFPEITLILVALGWLLYHFGGLRDRWR